MTLDIIKKANESKIGPRFKADKRELFTQGIFAGIGWAMGVTIGFVLLSVVLAFVLRSLGGIPIVGKWIATIVSATLEQLSTRTPHILQ